MTETGLVRYVEDVARKDGSEFFRDAYQRLLAVDPARAERDKGVLQGCVLYTSEQMGFDPNNPNDLTTTKSIIGAFLSLGLEMAAEGDSDIAPMIIAQLGLNDLYKVGEGIHRELVVRAQEVLSKLVVKISRKHFGLMSQSDESEIRFVASSQRFFGTIESYTTLDSLLNKAEMMIALASQFPLKVAFTPKKPEKKDALQPRYVDLAYERKKRIDNIYNGLSQYLNMYARPDKETPSQFGGVVELFVRSFILLALQANRQQRDFDLDPIEFVNGYFISKADHLKELVEDVFFDSQEIGARVPSAMSQFQSYLKRANPNKKEYVEYKKKKQRPLFGKRAASDDVMVFALNLAQDGLQDFAKSVQSYFVSAQDVDVSDAALAAFWGQWILIQGTDRVLHQIASASIGTDWRLIEKAKPKDLPTYLIGAKQWPEEVKAEVLRIYDWRSVFWKTNAEYFRRVAALAIHVFGDRVLRFAKTPRKWNTVEFWCYAWNEVPEIAETAKQYIQTVEDDLDESQLMPLVREFYRDEKKDTGIVFAILDRFKAGDTPISSRIWLSLLRHFKNRDDSKYKILASIPENDLVVAVIPLFTRDLVYSYKQYFYEGIIVETEAAELDHEAMVQCLMDDEIGVYIPPRSRYHVDVRYAPTGIARLAELSPKTRCDTYDILMREMMSKIAKKSKTGIIPARLFTLHQWVTSFKVACYGEWVMDSWKYCPIQYRFQAISCLPQESWQLKLANFSTVYIGDLAYSLGIDTNTSGAYGEILCELMKDKIFYGEQDSNSPLMEGVPEKLHLTFITHLAVEAYVNATRLHGQEFEPKRVIRLFRFVMRSNSDHQILSLMKYHWLSGEQLEQFAAGMSEQELSYLNSIKPGSVAYQRYEDAAKLARTLGAQSLKEYQELAREHSRLPLDPSILYDEEFWSSGGYQAYLDTSKQEPYPNIVEASKAAQKLKIVRGMDYEDQFFEDPRLPEFPDEYYEVDWEEFGGWKVFLGEDEENKKVTPKYTNGWYASCAVQLLGVKTPGEYRAKIRKDLQLPYNPTKKYKCTWDEILGFKRESPMSYDDASLHAIDGKITASTWKDFSYSDPHLPFNPKEAYGELWDVNNGWLGFLGIHETFELASESVQKLGIKNPESYRLRRSEDQYLPNKPDEVYKDWREKGGWCSFLGLEREEPYASYEEARKAAQALGIITSNAYVKNSWKDLKLPEDPAAQYEEFKEKGGWSHFGQQRPKESLSDTAKKVIDSALEESLPKRRSRYISFEALRERARAVGALTRQSYRELVYWKDKDHTPDTPKYAYPEEWKACGGTWADFLGVPKEDPYKTWEEASAALKVVDPMIVSQSTYALWHGKDPKLPENPMKQYADVWKVKGGWPGFHGYCHKTKRRKH